MAEFLQMSIADVELWLSPDTLYPYIDALVKDIYRDPSLRSLDEFNVDPQDLFEEAKKKSLESFFVSMAEPLLQHFSEPVQNTNTSVTACNLFFKLYVVASSFEVGECILDLFDRTLKRMILVADYS